MPTKKQSTKQAAAVLDAKLKAAMEEAHIAGVNAFEEFMRTSRLVQDGIVYDTAGWAFVKVRSTDPRRVRRAQTLAAWAG